MTSDSALSFSLQKQFNHATIRPIAASELSGIAFSGNQLLALDTRNGYLLEVDPLTHNTKILNPHHWENFIGATGLAIADNQLWFTYRNSIYSCNLDDPNFTCELFARLLDPANGIAIWESTIYVSCQKSGDIVVFSRETKKEITRLYTPGIGVENLTIRGEELWVSDTLEQSIYCLDRATGKQKFSLLTPFESPTGLAFYRNGKTGEEILYVAYVNQEPYIRDNPNADPNHELLYRVQTFIHPLHFYYDAENHYALSNGYLIEMSYVEELAPLDAIELENLEWRMALPAQTHRQKVRKVE
ncbi:MAG: transglutaminase, partial [Cyanobacteria bacterium P01_G01_bin.49]